MKTNLFSKITTLIIFAIGSANAQTPFPANVTVGVSKPGFDAAAKNYTIYTTTTPQSGIYNIGASFTPLHDLNGIGFDVVDRLVYASTYTGENNTSELVNGVSLFRIGEDGVNVDLGYLPTSGQTTIEFPSFSAGTVGTNDVYYYLTIGLKPTGVIKFTTALSNGILTLDTNDVRVFLCWIDNVSQLIPHVNAPLSIGGVSGFYEIDFQDHALELAMQAFLVELNANFPNVYNTNGGIQDIAINPIDSKIYGYFSYPENSTSTVGRPIVFEFPVNDSIAVHPVGNIISNFPNHEIDGITFDSTGNLYGVFTTGNYATIDLSTGALLDTTFSNFAIANANLRGDLGGATGSPYTTPLASGIVNFEGRSHKTYNSLNWNSVGENNNDRFIIERSSDSKRWTNIGDVTTKAPNGNSNTMLYYTFDDVSPKAATNYYRLQQVSKNKISSYSNVISIDNTVKEIGISISPNPAKQYFNVSGLQKGQMITLTNIEGKVVYQTKATSHQTTINNAQLPSGVYQAMITDNNGKILAVKKIQISK